LFCLVAGCVRGGSRVRPGEASCRRAPQHSQIENPEQDCTLKTAQTSTASNYITNCIILHTIDTRKAALPQPAQFGTRSAFTTWRAINGAHPHADRGYLK
jgi:hypothetical protein